jgi:hypothetical protein
VNVVPDNLSSRKILLGEKLDFINIKFTAPDNKGYSPHPPYTGAQHLAKPSGAIKNTLHISKVEKI